MSQSVARPLDSDGRSGRSLIESAYEVIREDVIRCKIAPGEQVSESGLAERYEIGRSAVRMALNRLAQDGLVEVVPREGYRVTPVTLKEVHDVCGARQLLEPPMARLAALHHAEPELERLTVLSQSEPPLNDLDATFDYLKHAKEFHTLIPTMGRNEFVAGLIGDIFDRSQRMLILCNFYDTPAGRSSLDLPYTHEEIVEAIAARDGDQAQLVMANHVTTFRMRLLEVLTTSPSLQTINLRFPAHGR